MGKIKTKYVALLKIKTHSIPACCMLYIDSTVVYYQSSEPLLNEPTINDYVKLDVD